MPGAVGDQRSAGDQPRVRLGRHPSPRSRMGRTIPRAGFCPEPRGARAPRRHRHRLARLSRRSMSTIIAAFRGSRPPRSSAWSRQLVSHARKLSVAIALLDAGAPRSPRSPRVCRTVSRENAAIAAMAADSTRGHDDLPFALEPEAQGSDRRTPATPPAILTYRDAGRDHAPYPDTRIAEAPIALWIADAAAANRKRWPFRAFARGALRKRIGPAFGLDKERCRPREGSRSPRRLCRDPAPIDTHAAACRNDSWRGLDTDLDRLTRPRCSRSGCGRRCCATRATSRPQLRTWSACPHPRRRARPARAQARRSRPRPGSSASAHAAFAESLVRYRAACGSDGDASLVDLASLAASADAIAAREAAAHPLVLLDAWPAGRAEACSRARCCWSRRWSAAASPRTGGRDFRHRLCPLVCPPAGSMRGRSSRASWPASTTIGSRGSARSTTEIARPPPTTSAPGSPAWSPTRRPGRGARLRGPRPPAPAPAGPHAGPPARR